MSWIFWVLVIGGVAGHLFEEEMKDRTRMERDRLKEENERLKRQMGDPRP